MKRTRCNLLILDDDPGVVDYLLEALEARGYACVGQTSPRAALECAKGQPFDAIVSDIEMPELRGTELVAALRAARCTAPVILMTAFGSVDSAVACMRAGAADFVTKPFQIEVLEHAIERSIREHRLRRELVRLRAAANKATTRHGVVAQSEAMRRVLDVAERAARSDTPILLSGESGTGKGAVARFIHESSGRAGAFVAVNCAALPGTLLESELFGVKRGAFTDAKEDREGLFVTANAGTLFLDEVVELPLESQAKMLTALETRRIRPVGSAREIAVDARVIAATNQSLEEALRHQRFRPDLYYRLNVIRIDLPPLRSRSEDIPALLDAYLPHAAKRAGRDAPAIDDNALRWLCEQPWPGNVRELLNVLDRAIALSEADTLTLEDFAPSVAPPAAADTFSLAVSERWPLERLTATYVRRMLAAVGGNKAEAARILGIDRRTLYSKLSISDDEVTA